MRYLKNLILATIIVLVLTPIVSFAEETGKIIISGTPVKGIDKYGFYLYNDIRNSEEKKYEVWLGKDNNWTAELELPYGKYYSLIEDDALLPKNIEVPENCRYVLRYGESPFYEIYEIDSSHQIDGNEKEPIRLYLLSTVAGGSGTEIKNIATVSEAIEYQVGKSEVEKESAFAEYDKISESISESQEIEKKQQEINSHLDTKLDNVSNLVIITCSILVIALISVIAYIVIKNKKDADDEY